MKVIFNSEQELAIMHLTALRIIVGCMVENRNSRERAFDSIEALVRLISDENQFEKMLNTYHKYVDEKIEEE